MKIKKFMKAFTLIELLVVITIIAILASIALPVFSSVQIKGQQTKALSNAKQIGLALRLWAGDHDGNFPSYTLSGGSPTTTTVSDSNTAFAELFPTYVQSENIFWQSKSAWCNSSAPDEVTDPAGTDTPSLTLAKGENEWAYVLGLNDTSNPAVPLLANGFVDQSSHTYTTDVTKKGGVWKGVKAIVVRADNSGKPESVDQTTFVVKGPNGGGATQNDIFVTTNGGNGWLGSTNTVVNPK